MGRIITQVSVQNPADTTKQVQFSALVDTGASGLVLPRAWRDRFGELAITQTVELETADQRVIEAEVAGPVTIQLEGFREISNEAMFIDMEPHQGRFEPLVGYIILEQSQAAVDMVGHRLVPVKYLDLK